MPARSPDGEARRLLLIAVSARALAEAARRAGFAPLVLDLFGDLDTRLAAEGGIRVEGSFDAGFLPEPLLAAVEQLWPGGARGIEGIVYGTGFEDRPALLSRVARDRHLLGNDPRVVAQVKHPASFFALLDRLGIPHPAIAFATPRPIDGWLVKRIGAAGGFHIAAAEGQGCLSADQYFQRSAEGRPISALLLARAGEARVLGFSEQWSAPAQGQPFRFGGAVQPAAITAEQAAILTAAAERVAVAAGLVGLNSADFLLREDGYDLLEVNPRPGATLDIFDPVGSTPLLGLHVAACQGEAPGEWQARSAAGCALVYAEQDAVVGTVDWPDWAADRPAPGTTLRPGDPVCTVLGQADTAAAARALLEARSVTVRDLLSQAPWHPGRREIAA